MDTLEQLKIDREETISCLRRGEFGYANEVIKKIVDFMQPEFRAQVVGQFNACNYIRVADLLEHLWTHVELPGESVDSVATNGLRLSHDNEPHQEQDHQD